MRTLLLFGVWIAVAPNLAASSDSTDATVEWASEAEASRIIEKLAAPWATVTRWLLEYEAIPSTPAAGAFPVRKITAVSSSGDYYGRLAHMAEDIPWSADPFQQELFIRDGHVCQRYSFKRGYNERTLKPGDYLPATASADIVLGIVPNWPLKQYKVSNIPNSDISPILVEALKSGTYRISTSAELVNGEPCAIFDHDGHDRIWIATNKGLCLMRRDLKDVRSKRLTTRTLVDAVREVGPGSWLASRYRVQYFAAVGTNQPVLEGESRITIVRFILNNPIPDSVFMAVHKPGSIRFENKGPRFTQVSADGEELLDQVVSFMTDHAALPTQNARASRWSWVMGGAAAGLCTALVLPRRKRASKGKRFETSPASLPGVNS